MLHIIFDTNIWIYIGEGIYPNILEFIKAEIENGEIELLMNDVLHEEWSNNKENVFANVMNRHIRKYDTSFPIDITIEESKQRVIEIEDLMKNYSKKVEISNEVEQQVRQIISEGEAPYNKKDKDYFGDATIFFSTLDFIKKNKTGRVLNKAIFVTENFTDFSEVKKKKNPLSANLHPNLQKHIGGLDFTYQTNVAEVLNLAPKYITQINEWAIMVENARRLQELKTEFMKLHGEMFEILRMAKQRNSHIPVIRDSNMFKTDIDYLLQFKMISNRIHNLMKPWLTIFEIVMHNQNVTLQAMEGYVKALKEIIPHLESSPIIDISNFKNAKDRE